MRTKRISNKNCTGTQSNSTLKVLLMMSVFVLVSVTVFAVYQSDKKTIDKTRANFEFTIDNPSRAPFDSQQLSSLASFKKKFSKPSTQSYATPALPVEFQQISHETDQLIEELDKDINQLTQILKDFDKNDNSVAIQQEINDFLDELEQKHGITRVTLENNYQEFLNQTYKPLDQALDDEKEETNNQLKDLQQQLQKLQ